MSKVLIVYHSLSGNTKQAAEAVADGARQVPDTEVQILDGLKAGPADLLACDAIAVGTPDYFSYMAGGVKDFFDRSFYPTQGKVVGKPCAIFVTHGGGGKAADSMKSVCASFKFEVVADPVLVQSAPDAQAKKALAALGHTLATKARK